MFLCTRSFLCDLLSLLLFLTINFWYFNTSEIVWPVADYAGITVTLELLLYAGKWTGADSQIKTFLSLFPFV